MKSTIETLDKIVIEKPGLGKGVQNLCLDKGYDSKNIEYNVVERGYITLRSSSIEVHYRY
jgi:hypothetical protein